MAGPRTLLVDLDGTLIDPAEGILASYRHGLAAVGAEVAPDEPLGWVIGPPLRVTFARYMPAERVGDAVAAYRAFFGGGAMYRARIYDGIPSALDALRADGWRLFICTVKPQGFAAPLVQHLGLDRHFSGVYGSELSGRFDDKADLIEHILAEHGIAPDETMMIGDRGLDVIAARRNGVSAIGVSWGYGSSEELEEAGAAHVCAAPLDLPIAVTRLGSAGAGR